MKFHMTKVLRFWVDVEYERIKNHHTPISVVEMAKRNIAGPGNEMIATQARTKSRSVLKMASGGLGSRSR